MTKALLEFIAMQIPFLSKRSNTKSKIVRFTSMMYSQKVSHHIIWTVKYQIINSKLKMVRESGTYEKLEY